MQCLLAELDVPQREPVNIHHLGERVYAALSTVNHQTPWHGQLDTCGVPKGTFLLHPRPIFQQTVSLSGIQDLQADKKSGIADRLRHGSRRRYDLLKAGRFQFLDISELILTGVSLQYINSYVRLDAPKEPETADAPDKQQTLLPTLENLWSPGLRHALVMGNDGMGKTVSCVHLWRQLLDDPGAPLPLYVSLNEYNAVPSAKDGEPATEEEKHFIRNYLLQHYLKTFRLEPDDEAAFWQFLEQPSGAGAQPSALLFLDGLNEVTRDKGWLEKEVRDLRERCPALQLVVTTRYDLRGFTFLHDFARIDLLDLTDEQKEAFLRDAARKMEQQVRR